MDRLDEIAALAGDVLVEGARSIRRSTDLNGLFARWARLSDRVMALAERLPRRRRDQRLVEQLEGDVHLLRSDTFRFARQPHRGASTAQRPVRASWPTASARPGSSRSPASWPASRAPPATWRGSRARRSSARSSGAETGVDKAILLSLNDPLVHLVRNSVDHGVEPPEERARGRQAARRASSPSPPAPTATCWRVTVEDDGRGIDPAAGARRRPCARGSSAEQQAAGLSARAAIDLIFLPGFSTREQAGETSGRGVGLDVVRRKVTALGGSVAVESEPGKGTRFTLRMPQSLSLMKVLLVRIDEDVYGLPATDVDSVGRLDRQGHHRGGRHPRGALPQPAPAGGGPGPAALAQRRPALQAAAGGLRAGTARRGRRWWWTASSASARWR